MKRVVTNRWFLSSLGLLALALLVWLLGPLFGFGASRPLETERARLITILGVVLLWALSQLRKAWRARRANQGIAEGLVAAAPEPRPDRSAEEVAALRERFEQAITVLRKSKGRRGRLGLYDLPWYIIIGPPGSGKTTALRNSGLDFPLADRFGPEALGGVGGTRNCDWWFTDEAILLDTAGRYTTQDSEVDVDRSAWNGFLELLKKYRPRRPVNGVLVAISLLDLMTQPEHERAAHARAIRTRINELDQFFKIRFPVYVVFTKCDLVAGFMEFFEDLGRTEREQVWGATFPVEASESRTGPVEQFGAEFDSLLERLSERVLWRMSQERDRARRAAICGFPTQLASLKNNLEPFLRDVFRGNRFEQSPMLRGVYFTSGTQQGAPIDRLMAAVARSFGLEQESVVVSSAGGRSYFLKSLLTDVVFAESELAGTNRRTELKRALLQKVAYAGCILLAAALVLGWTFSHINNRELVDEVRTAAETAQRAVEDAAAPAADVLTVLPALEVVSAIPGGYDDRDEGAPLMSSLGLYQGEKLGRQARSAYRRVLRQVLLPQLILRLEGQLRAGGDGPDFQYLALKTYLMLDSRDHYDADELTAWFEVDFRSNLPREVSTAEREALSTHIDALFEEPPSPLPLPLDQALIAQTQRTVARMPPEERIYSSLRRRSGQLRPFTLFDAGGPRAPLVFMRRSAPLNEGIIGFFTRAGYQQVLMEQGAAEVERLIAESWILGDYAPTDLVEDRVLDRVRDLYLTDYVRQYEQLILDLELVPFSTPEAARDVLNILSDRANSPLLRLLEALGKETQLESSAERIVDSVADRARNAVERLEDALRNGDDPAKETPVAGTIVDQHFRWIRDLLGEDSTTAPIQSVLTLLDELYNFMAVVVEQRGLQGELPASVAQQGQDVAQRLRTVAGRQPEMMQTLLEQAAGSSQTLAFRGVMANINSEWKSRGLPFCRRAISGLYPIVRDSPDEIDLEEFGAFFGPDGIVETFFDAYLVNYVDRSRSPWLARSSTAAPVRIARDALRQFERASAIRDTFFRSGGDVPSVSFDMRPLTMDGDILQFTLDLGGQRLVYNHDPVQTKDLRWPGPDSSREVRIEMAPLAPESSIMRESGPWAWFRILDRATVTPTDRVGTFEVKFTIGSRSAHYEMSTRSPYNPFNFPDLHEFSCPESL